MTTGDAAPEQPARAAEYDCGSITILDGVDCVRRRPGMYIGDTQDGSGLHNLAQEVIENALQEHLVGGCLRIAVTIHAGGALTVEDDGPGIPIEPAGPLPNTTPLLETILTTLHAIPTRQRSARVAMLYSLGLGAVNALCEALVVEVRRGGRLYRQQYRRGRPEAPLACVGRAEGTGTRITVHPDPLIFASTTFEAHRLAALLRPIAFRNPGLRLDLADERRGGRRETFHTRGLGEWVALLTEGQAGFPEEPLHLCGTRDGLAIDVALRWTRSRGTRLRGFANQWEVRSGAHLFGLFAGLGQAVKRAAHATYGEAAPRRYDPRRLEEGLVAIVDLRGPSIEISGCSRDKLTGRGIQAAVQDFIADTLTRVLTSDRALLDGLLALTAAA